MVLHKIHKKINISWKRIVVEVTHTPKKNLDYQDAEKFLWQTIDNLGRDWLGKIHTTTSDSHWVLWYSRSSTDKTNSCDSAPKTSHQNLGWASGNRTWRRAT